jgi:hypothetical protein
MAFVGNNKTRTYADVTQERWDCIRQWTAANLGTQYADEYTPPYTPYAGGDVTGVARTHLRSRPSMFRPRIDAERVVAIGYTYDAGAATLTYTIVSLAHGVSAAQVWIGIESALGGRCISACEFTAMQGSGVTLSTGVCSRRTGTSSYSGGTTCGCDGKCGAWECRSCVRKTRGTLAAPCADSRHEVITEELYPFSGLPPRWLPKRPNPNC